MCKQTIDEIFTESKMTGLKFVIVEGHDDPCVYEKITSQFTEICITPIELIDGYAGGSAPIIAASKYLEQQYGTDPYLGKAVLFIADKDVRDFRGEIITNSTILFLKEYSIESHFVNKESIKKAIEFATRCPISLITDQIIDLIYDEIEGSTKHLFLCSIDALNAALSSSYTPDVTYDTKYGYLANNPMVISAISAKENQLNADASARGLNKNLVSLKKFAKGKWLLDGFCSGLTNSIEELANKCAQGVIPPCGYCTTNDPAKCFRKMEIGINSAAIRTHIKKLFPHELGYITARIQVMYT